MASIYLVRHGQASFGQQNYDDLSDLGQQQARMVGAAFAARQTRIDAVVTGSMQRHKQTARGFLQAYTGDDEGLASIPTSQDSGWDEYDFDDILTAMGPDYASADAINKTVARQANPKQAFEKMFNQAMDRWISGEYDGDYKESWSTYQSRIHQALQSVVDQTRKPDSNRQNVLVFTSGGVISVVAQALLGVPSEKMMHMNWTLMKCAVTKLVASKHRLFVASLNEHSHFEGKDARQYISYK